MDEKRTQGTEAPGKGKGGGPQLPHQAVLFLLGVLAEGVFRSERLPEGVGISLGGRARENPEGEAGEGIFSLWPRTNGEGRLLGVQVATRLREPYAGPEAVAQGVLIWADRGKLTLLIIPKAGEPFPITFLRGRDFTAPMEVKKAYRVEGRLEGEHLVAERAWPLGKYLEAKRKKEPVPPAIAGRENPYLERAGKGEGKKKAPVPLEKPPAPKAKEARRDPVRVWRAPEEPQDPAPPDLGRPPALRRGQIMGIAGTGPFYLVLLPQAVPEWWPRVEARLPELTRRHEVRFYPDGSRAVVCGDLEALKVWYKRVLMG
ncbi:MAG: hypothetical protein ACK4HT_07760 [Thermus caldifontis]